MQNGGTCAPNTDYSTYANRLINISSDTIISNVWGSCGTCVSGCTDPTATNYNSNAGYDDGSCSYNSNFNVTFQLDMNNVTTSFTTPEVNGTFNGWCGNCWAMSDADGDNIWDYTISIPSGSYEYKFSADNWTIQEDLSGAGTCVVSAWGYTNRVLNITSDTILPVVCWESCSVCFPSGLVSGCTDSTANNYDTLANSDDGSCTYSSSCSKPVPTGIYIDEIIQVQAKIHWDNMSDSNCMALKYYVNVREVGTSTWSWRVAQDAGLCNQGLPTTSKVMINLTASTDYEYRVKAFYCNTTGSSAWSPMGYFTTDDDCPNVTNFTAIPGPQSQKVVFTWDTLGSYSMVRIKLRVDSISNPVGSDWQTAGGFGVNYPALTVNKWGVVAGETYRGQARTWCDPNGGLYRSTNWTPLIWWTQPTVIRVEGGTTITNLEVYPNPSRDIFNVSFTSEDVQSLEVRIINVIGEVVYTENLVEFVGEYTKQIDLDTYAKGVYFLEITTDNGVINKKIVLC